MLFELTCLEMEHKKTRVLTKRETGYERVLGMKDDSFDNPHNSLLISLSKSLVNYTSEKNRSIDMLSSRFPLHTKVTVSCGRCFSSFVTGVPKSVRNGEGRHVQRNLKKEYIRKRGKSHSSTIWLDRQLRDPYSIRVVPVKRNQQ